MTELTENMFKIFDREEFSFKKLKEKYTPEEVDAIKAKFKAIWQIWKQVQLNVAEKLPAEKFAKVHVESWTNGWNLRDHYWASYRLADLADKSPCIGVMLDKKQLQVYLMFQHYNSEKRGDTPEHYNQLMTQIPAWSKNINVKNWFLWDRDEMESADHLSLQDYLTDKNVQTTFNQEAKESSFLLGKFVFREEKLADMEDFITQMIKEILPLYEELLER